jgi:hypothetical protein
MNAALAKRLAELEARAIRAMTDEQLEAMTSGEHEWVRSLTDDELEQLIAGGPIPPRLAAFMRNA